MDLSKLTIVTLNCWGGRAIEAMESFFARYRHQVHVFCLQEVYDTDQSLVDARHPNMGLCADMFGRICSALPAHEGWFARFPDLPERMSLAVFVRRDLHMPWYGHTEIYRPANPIEHGEQVFAPRRLQLLQVGTGEKAVFIANYHGIYTGGDKVDTPERLQVSRHIRKRLDSVTSNRRVLCGDFNLQPGTLSLCILAQGQQNPIAMKHIASTRTPLYRHFNDAAHSQHADYVLASPDLRISKFVVLPDNVSDHAALLCTVE